MNDKKFELESAGANKERAFPPGRIKIAQALRILLENNDFASITTAEIAKTAGVTEALIYKYFKDKRDLLHQVLAEYLAYYLDRAESDLKGIKGALNKIRKIIWSHINVYATDRVFAKIILVDVRSSSDYYLSEPYKTLKKYFSILRNIIREGVAEGEIRDDLPPSFILQAILGGIEQVCLSRVVFNREIDPDELTEHLCEFIFHGIAREKKIGWS